MYHVECLDAGVQESAADLVSRVNAGDLDREEEEWLCPSCVGQQEAGEDANEMDRDPDFERVPSHNAMCVEYSGMVTMTREQTRQQIADAERYLHDCVCELSNSSSEAVRAAECALTSSDDITSLDDDARVCLDLITTIEGLSVSTIVSKGVDAHLADTRCPCDAFICLTALWVAPRST